MYFLDHSFKHLFTPFNENLLGEAPPWAAAKACLVKTTSGLRAGPCTWGTWSLPQGEGTEDVEFGFGLLHGPSSEGRCKGEASPAVSVDPEGQVVRDSPGQVVV